MIERDETVLFQRRLGHGGLMRLDAARGWIPKTARFLRGEDRTLQNILEGDASVARRAERRDPDG